ncbi:MAG: tetratricopeptide repeat protein [Acidobacteria bacterium]|nr:tetratricopeptide repeat protein [Acidobacteriota bacterium]
MKRSLAVASQDPEESFHLAELAQEAVKKIIGREMFAGGEKAIPDLNALARAHLGNACRLLHRFDEAEDHFRDALVFLVQGSGDPMVFGDVYSLYGSYLRCRRRFRGALVVLEKAEEVFLKLRSTQRQAKILIQRAAVLEDLGELEAAVRAVRTALPLLAGEGSQSLKAAAYHNLAFYLSELGRSEEAFLAYEEGENLFRWLPVPAPGTTLLRRWTHGKVRWGLGEFNRAEDLLQEALQGFERSQDPYRCALVSLDLAGLYAEQDRFEDLVAIVTTTYEGLRQQALDEEAEKVLRLLMESGQRRQVTLAVVRAAALQLRASLSCTRASC